MKGTRIIASRLGLFSIVSLVLAALSSAVLADAEPPASPAPPAEHLLVVPATAEGTAAMAAADARVVARYESFSLVEASGADDRRLRDAGAQRRDDMREVTTAAGPVDPATDRGSLAGKQAPDRVEVLALVQFVGPPKGAWLERLRATGAQIVTYQAQNGYVVHASGDAVDRVAALVGTDTAVRAVIPLGAADKLVGPTDIPGRYAISTVAGDAGQDARDHAAADGQTVGAPITVGALRTQFLELHPDQVAALARDPSVVAVERDAAPTPSDERTAQIAAGNLNGLAQPSGPDYLAWHDARFPSPFSFAIDVTDTGLDNGTLTPDHPDFYELGSTANPDRVDYQANYTGDSDARDCTGHGTNVASIAAGYNSSAGPASEDGSFFQYGLGVAPLAEIGSSKIFDCTGAPVMTWSPATVTSNAYAGDARISNNSWGTGSGLWGEYTMRSRAYDELVRDAQSGTPGNQEMVEVFAAGNDGDETLGGSNEGYGTIHAEGSAKNVITVGASEGVRASGTDGCNTPNTSADSARDIANFSGRGPTDDDRLKPDLVAPGTHVTGARPLFAPMPPPAFNGSGTCDPFFAGTYSLVSGTSQAAPQVAGAAALVRDWYTRTQGSAPSPALTKALLINTADDLAGGNNGKGDTIAAGPNHDQGWGRVDVGAAIDGTPRRFYDQSDLLQSGQSSARAFTVQDTSKPVKVTLVWTDAPGPPLGAIELVNDLDLEVAGAGHTYLGNVFGGAYSRTGGGPDVRNNVESVTLPPGTSGRFAVTVRGTSIGVDGVPGGGATPDQDYALVVSNAAEQPAPVLAHQATTVDDSGPGGDGDGVLESDEQVQLGEQVHNAGTDPATAPLDAALTGSGTLGVTQGSSAFPAIAAGSSASNSSPFAAHLANAATCGADAGATLAIATAAGTQTIPLVLPTGAPGAIQSYPAGQVPLAIPDDDAAGVSSSVFVPDRGRIKDLDVTIAGIQHTWVGDLAIDIVGPDGTTVRLADHPGGADNGGDDFTGTVFSDQAPTNISDGAAPYTGQFRPQNDQLSRFDGRSRQGTWTLRVRDLFEGDTGTLQGWGVTTQKALCNVDTTAPDTSFAVTPAGQTSSTSAQFTFASNDAGATFECRLDGGAYASCPATMTFGGLALGSHTVSARAIDGSDNEDATPASYTWLIAPDAPPTSTPAASFVLAPAEARLADALAGRYDVLAACASACRVSATVSVPKRTARRLDLASKAVTIGDGARRRASPGTAKVAVHLTRRARSALRGRKLTNATLKVTLAQGASKLTLTRAVSLRSSAGLPRIARHGLRLWAACARRCPLRGELTLSASQAKRLRLKPGHATRYQVASGRTTATTTPRMLVLAVRRSARGALARARRVGALLEAVAGTAPDPLRSAKLTTTLRR